MFITHSFHQSPLHHHPQLLAVNENQKDQDEWDQDSEPTKSDNNEDHDTKLHDGSIVMSDQKALESFANYLGIEIESIEKIKDSTDLKLNNFPQIPISLKWIQLGNSKLRLVWDIQLDLDTNWFSAQIDATTGKILALNDWVSHATFNVFPVGTNDPTDSGRVMQENPEHPLASPIGWNAFKNKDGKSAKTKDTQGNNVYAQVFTFFLTL